MPKVRDSEIKNLTTTKREFVSALKKVSQRIDQSKPSPKTEMKYD